MLRYTGLTIWRARFPLRLTFSHNLATRSEAETLLVELRTSSGHCGYGQVLPRHYLTGETINSSLEYLVSDLWPALQALILPTAGGEAAWREALHPLYTRSDSERRTAAWAGVDIAGYDAWARSTGSIPPAGNRIPLVGVIPALGPRKAWLLARLLRLMGFRHFKVKVGQDASRDTARLRAVRAAIGAAWLAADANAAWDADEALARMRGLSEWGVSVVEEPLMPAVAASADYRRLEADTGVATMADESLCTLADAKGLIERGRPSWWNLRLAKNGGLNGYRILSALAAEVGATVYGGILVGETGALAAACRVAWRDGSCGLGEYGFPRVFLKKDPFRGSPAGYAGYMDMAATLGLGVTTTAENLHRAGADVVFSYLGD
ncbi:MAG: hypothetical protein LUC93_07520 [Planctomycetaceae bacterium]|nr:hypothetical protein [Planctomycetaceae bacterium]